MKKVAIYLRFATNDAQTILLQTTECLAYAAKQNYTVVGVYSDIAVSGMQEKRSQFEMMLAVMDNWDAVIVKKLSRISRDASTFYSFIETLKKNEKELISLVDGTVSFEFIKILKSLKGVN